MQSSERLFGRNAGPVSGLIIGCSDSPRGLRHCPVDRPTGLSPFTWLPTHRQNIIVVTTRLKPTTTQHFEDQYLLVYCLILIVNRNLFIHYFIFHCKRNGIPLSTTLLYFKQNVFYWPDDDRLRSKHVAIVKPIAYIILLY